MERNTYGKILFSCLCFLALIYALAGMDRKNRIPNSDLATMAENKQENESNTTPADSKIMYLTFDDGPSQNTPEVLNILDQYQIKATFFVTGEDEASFDLLQEIHKRGHVLGIHTYSHSYRDIYQSVDAYFEDVKQVEQLIFTQTGITPKILRFPGGSSNTVSRKYHEGIMSELVTECERRGLTYYDWNADNGDGNPDLSPDTLYETAMKTSKGKQEVMMLMHDGKGNANTVKALDRILQELIRQGWEFRVIEDRDDMPIFHHTIAN